MSASRSTSSNHQINENLINPTLRSINAAFEKILEEIKTKAELAALKINKINENQTGEKLNHLGIDREKLKEAILALREDIHTDYKKETDEVKKAALAGDACKLAERTLTFIKDASNVPVRAAIDAIAYQYEDDARSYANSYKPCCVAFFALISAIIGTIVGCLMGGPTLAAAGLMLGAIGGGAVAASIIPTPDTARDHCINDIVAAVEKTKPVKKTPFASNHWHSLWKTKRPERPVNPIIIPTPMSGSRR